MKTRQCCIRFAARRAGAARVGAKRNANVFRKRAPRVSQRRGYSSDEHEQEHEQD
jgi:hypothetical protein